MDRISIRTQAWKQGIMRVVDPPKTRFAQDKNPQIWNFRTSGGAQQPIAAARPTPLVSTHLWSDPVGARKTRAEALRHRAPPRKMFWRIQETRDAQCLEIGYHTQWSSKHGTVRGKDEDATAQEAHQLILAESSVTDEILSCDGALGSACTLTGCCTPSATSKQNARIAPERALPEHLSPKPIA